MSNLLQPERLFPTKHNKLGGPEARSGHRIVVDEGNIYCYGGYNPTSPTAGSANRGRNMDEFPMFRELWRYNLASNQWEELQTTGSIPNESASYACILINHKLFVFGGTGFPFAEVRNNVMYCCDLTTLKWDIFQCSGTLPEKVYGHTMLYLNGFIYLFGGTTGFLYNNDMFKLNTTTHEWKIAYRPLGDDEAPSPRYRHEMASDGKYLYVFGGGTSITAEPLINVWAFDTINETWKSIFTKPDENNEDFTDLRKILSGSIDHVLNQCYHRGFPAPRKCHGCIQKDQYVYISGGLGDDNTPAYKDVWRYHMPTAQWSKLPINLRKEVYFHATALSPSCGSIYLFGGVISRMQENNTLPGPASRRSRALYKMPISVKSLLQHSWEAIILNFPLFLQLPQAVLIRYGVPHHLVSRLDKCQQKLSQPIVASAS